MVHLAAQTGTTDIIATPHANSQFAFRPEVVEEKLSALREAAAGLIRIHSDSDFHLHYDNIQDALARPEKYTIAHRSYLLVEF
jgi:protein-tyrosine phosphatase